MTVAAKIGKDLAYVYSNWPKQPRDIGEKPSFIIISDGYSNSVHNNPELILIRGFKKVSSVFMNANSLDFEC